MLDVTPQLTAINSANPDAMVRFVATSLDDAERLLKSQHEVAKKLFADNAEAFRAMVDPAGNGEALAEWPKLCAGNVGKIFDVTRESIELIAHSQAEFVQMMGRQAATLHQSVAETVASLAGATGAGGAPAKEEVVRPKRAA
jgi:hypothetical protein